MSTHNIGFYEEISKIYPELSPNTHPISSSKLESMTISLSYTHGKKLRNTSSPIFKFQKFQLPVDVGDFGFFTAHI